MGLFTRKKEWRDDDYVFLEDLKKDPLQEDNYFEEEKVEPPKVDLDKVETVKERLERMHKEDHGLVKRRLQNLQVTPSSAPKPLNDRFFNERVAEPEEKVEIPENSMLKRVEAAIKKIDAVKQKMDKSNSYLSLFYDLKKAEKEFLAVLEEANEQVVVFPEYLEKKIEDVKSKIRMVK